MYKNDRMTEICFLVFHKKYNNFSQKFSKLSLKLELLKYRFVQKCVTAATTNRQTYLN